MTVIDAAKRLFAHFSPEERSIPDDAIYPGRNADVLAAINGALEEIFSKGGLFTAQDERGVNLKAPVSLQISVTEDSKDAVIEEADWKDWMGGCTIVIEGHEIDNQIRNDKRQVILRYPYAGETGTISATIYHDSVQLDEDVMSVHDPVMIDGIQIPAVSHPSVLVQTTSDRDFGFHERSASALVRRVSASASAPRGYSVESWQTATDAAPTTRIRLTPSPADPCFLQYVVQTKPPAIDRLESDQNLPIPHNFASSIFIPIAEMSLSASPFWRGVLSKESLTNNYRNAIDLLSKSNPRTNRGLRLFSRY